MSKLKQLQINFTTPEQSKRLMLLGLQVNSADETYRLRYEKNKYHNDWVREAESFRGNVDDFRLPCWTVGRLIEIYEICTRSVFERNDLYTPLNDIYTSIESMILNHKFDFSKLNE